MTTRLGAALLALLGALAAPAVAQKDGVKLSPVKGAQVPVQKVPVHKPPLQQAPGTAARDLTLDRATVGAMLLRPSGAPQKLEVAAGASARVPRDVVLVEKLGQAAVTAPPAAGRLAGAVRVELPYRFSVVGSDGAENRSQLVVQLLTGGLRMTPGSSDFTGEMEVFLEDLVDPRRSYALPANLVAQVSVSAEIDSVAPNSFQLAKVGEAQRVSMSWRKPRSPAFNAHFRSNFDADGLDVEVNVLTSKLAITVTPESIAGLGLESTRIVVTAPDALDPAGLQVTLAADGGNLEDATLELDAQGRTETTLRSTGLGDCSVTASSSQLEAASATVRFTAPWPFVLAALIGGLAGAFIKRAQGGRKGRRQSVPAALSVGAVTGLLVAALYALGVNVLPVDFKATSGEALVLCVAGLGAFVGLRLPSAKAED